MQIPVFESEVSERLSQPGVAVGLAWTTMGGEIMYVEATRMEGEGKLTLTGQLGDVMKESATLALNWLRSNLKQVCNYLYNTCAGYNSVLVLISLNILIPWYTFSFCLQLNITALTSDILENTDIHIHFPAGAVGKDGPSAGVTVVTVLTSLFTGRCVRSDTAMTGEITLRGLVLPVKI